MNKNGLNKERSKELLESVESVLNEKGHITKEEIDNLKESKVLDKIEHLEKHEEIQEVAQEINNQNVQNILEENDNMKRILDMNIKGALNFAKGKSTKGLNGKQYKAITEGYERVIDEKMSDKQCEYIKTITDAQAIQVIAVINAYQRHLRSLAVANN